MNAFYPGFMIFLILLTSSGCKKNQSEDMSSRTRLLTQQSWKMTKYEQRYDPAASWVDETATYDACELDNKYSFSSNGSFQVTEGLTKCSPSDPDILENGTWSFQNNENVLRMITSQGTVDLTIEILDGADLRYTVSDPGVPIFLRFSFGH